MEKQIHIIGREVGKPTNRFIAFKAFIKDGGRETIKFTRQCENVPKKEGQYVITVDSKEINKGSDDYGVVWWVKNIISCVPYEKPELTDEELPF